VLVDRQEGGRDKIEAMGHPSSRCSREGLLETMPITSTTTVLRLRDWCSRTGTRRILTEPFANATRWHRQPAVLLFLHVKNISEKGEVKERRD